MSLTIDEIVEYDHGLTSLRAVALFRYPDMAPEAMQFLRSCLEPDPARRLSADELLALPYFKGAEDLIPGMEEVTKFLANQWQNVTVAGAAVGMAPSGSAVPELRPTADLQPVALPPAASAAFLSDAFNPHTEMDKECRSEDVKERTRAAIAQAKASIAAAAEAVEKALPSFPLSESTRARDAAAVADIAQVTKAMQQKDPISDLSHVSEAPWRGAFAPMAEEANSTFSHARGNAQASSSMTNIHSRSQAHSQGLGNPSTSQRPLVPSLPTIMSRSEHALLD